MSDHSDPREGAEGAAPIRVLSVVGARPNFMKIAPLVRAMKRAGGFSSEIVHTGQHYDANMSGVFFEELGIPAPDVNLGVGSGPREEQIARISEAFEPVASGSGADLVVVVGDVNSTIACASVARRLGIRVAHVEAGLRSFDETMPEELNRRETDAISDYLFVTEPAGMRNLDDERCPGKAYLVGNVMIDTLVAGIDRARASEVPEQLGLAGRDYFVATFHRPSNVDERRSLEQVLQSLAEIAARLPVVLPLHPRTRGSLERHGLLERAHAIEDLVLTEPLGYIEFMGLVCRARGVVTDSGGLQEETTYLHVPCITMRENTERPITIESGSNVLVGGDFERLIREVDGIVAGEHDGGRCPELWDGHTAERIVEILRAELGGTA